MCPGTLLDNINVRYTVECKTVTIIVSYIQLQRYRLTIKL
mgnify:CR=1 FL=1